MPTLKREWIKVADLPGAPFRGAFPDYKAKLLPVQAGQTIRVPKDTKLFRMKTGAFLSKRTYRVKVDHVLTGSDMTHLGHKNRVTNPQPRWPGSGGYWTEADINDVEVEGAWVWCQPWIERERGWGVRPDGYTLHTDKDGAKRMLAKMRKREASEGYSAANVPDEYSEPSGKPYRCFITDPAELAAIEKAKDGVWGKNGNTTPPEWRD